VSSAVNIFRELTAEVAEERRGPMANLSCLMCQASLPTELLASRQRANVGINFTRRTLPRQFGSFNTLRSD